MSNSKAVSTPLTNHFKTSLNQCLKTNAEVEYMLKVPYVNVVGYLMHVMVCSRPDMGSDQVDFQVHEGSDGSLYNVRDGVILQL